MARLFLLALTLTFYTATTAEETVLSSLLTPNSRVNRQLRGYYDYRYARPLYDRLEYRDDRHCGRCDDKSDRSDEDDDDYDDRRHKPTSGKRYDKKDDDDGFDHPKNSTDDKDDKDRPSRRKHKNRYDDRDRYRPDYYDRFLRDPYRERAYERPYRPYDRAPYDDPYAYRRPVYDRYDDGYGGYGPSAGRGPHESFRPWDETYRGQSGWDAAGRGYYFASGRPEPAPYRPEYPRPVESGWGGSSGYSGYQDPYRGSGYGSQGASYGQNSGYGQSGYGGGYSQSPSYGGYNQGSGYRDPYASYGSASSGYGGASGGYGGASGGYGGASGGYGGASGGYGGSSGGYGGSTGGYGSSSAAYGGSSGYGGVSGGYGSSGTPSGWHSVGERRPYRDESGVNNLDKRDRNQQTDRNQNGYKTNRQPYGGVNGNSGYNQDNAYGQSTYGQPTYGKPSTYEKSTYGQQNTGGSTTAETSYLFQRSDENVTSTDETTKAP